MVKGGHSVYRLEYHVVWVCKYRRKILNPGVSKSLERVLPKLLTSMPGVELEKIGFDQDHVHMVMVIPPSYSIAEVMGQLKSQSSAKLRRRYSWLGKVYRHKKVIWSPGYFVSSVGVDEEIIKRYVEHQGKEDSGQLRMKL